jgi:hypothetical protein
MKKSSTTSLGFLMGVYPMVNKRDMIFESLRTQLEFIAVVRARHLMWANDTENPAIAHLHAEIANSYMQTKKLYSQLIDEYDKAKKWGGSPAIPFQYTGDGVKTYHSACLLFIWHDCPGCCTNQL